MLWLCLQSTLKWASPSSFTIFFFFLFSFSWIQWSSRQHLSHSFWDSGLMQIGNAFHQIRMTLDAWESSCHQTALCSCRRECFLSTVEAPLNGCQYAFLPIPSASTDYQVQGSVLQITDPAGPTARNWSTCLERQGNDHPGWERETDHLCPAFSTGLSAHPSLLCQNVQVRECFVSRSSWQLFYTFCLLFRLYHLVP